MRLDRYTSKSPKQTELLGEKLSRGMPPGSVIELIGSYGAGKSTLVRGLAKGLGISRRVVSPSFILFQRFPLQKTKRGIRYLTHIDLWRVRRLTSEDRHGIREALAKRDAITAVEWPSRLPPSLRRYTTHRIRLDTTGASSRKVTVTNLRRREASR